MALRSLPIALVLLILGLLAPSASANPAGSDFTIDPNPPNPGQVVTFTFVPGPGIVGTPVVQWDVTGNTDFDETGLVATQSYDAPGPVTVRMQVTDDKGTLDPPVEKTFNVNAPPVVSFDFTPTSPLPGVEVWFDQVVTDPNGDPVTLAWDFGDGDTATGANPRHTYATPNTRTVKLTATDAHGASTVETRQLTVEDPAGPTPSFTYSPAVPLVGQIVTFTNTSTPSSGSITSAVWDLDDDGEFDDSPLNWSFSTAGNHEVSVRVTQTNGNQAVQEQDIRVNAAPIAVKPSFITPFPVVRLAGRVLPHGARVRLLAVRAPRGALVRVRCAGKGCPVRLARGTSTGRTLRFRKFERRVPAGVRLEIFVRKSQMIGKYTRFLVRAGAPPRRTDRCLFPGIERPRACP